MLVTFVRTIVLYLVVSIAMRFMGKRQLGELQPSELVIALMISEMASIPIQSIEIPLLNGIIPLITLAVSEIFLSYLNMKLPGARKFISGNSIIIIKDGKVNLDQIKKLRINYDDIMEELRISGYPDIDNVKYGILETNGKLTVLPKN